MRIRPFRHLGWLSLVLGVCLGAPAGAAVPVTGDWEGTGPHGLPLSFGLARSHGRIVATGAVIGFPESCPAQARDAQAAPLSGLSYTGPGAAPANPLYGAPVIIAGHSSGISYQLTGDFTGSRTASFSTLTNDHVGCGWPTRNLVWSKVRPARRRSVADGVWRGSLDGGGLSRSTLRLTVAGGGRSVTSFSGDLNCADGQSQTFNSSTSNEFIDSGGAFDSPLTGQGINGVQTLWTGRFDGHGHLGGSLRIANPCGAGTARLSFHATRA